MGTLELDLSTAEFSQAAHLWAQYQGLRGKSTLEILHKVMRYWVSFAMAKIKPGDAAKIRAQLMTLTAQYSKVRSTVARTRGSKTADKYRGTIAAAIVAIINYKGARLMAAFGDTAGFYSLVGQFIGRRVYSRNLHRVAGFLPAMTMLRMRPRESGPRYARPPGTAEETLTEDIASIFVENFASSAHGSGIAAMHPEAFSSALPEVITLIEKFVLEDMIVNAKAAGFYTDAGLNVTALQPYSQAA